MIRLLSAAVLGIVLFTGATCERPLVLEIEPPAPELVVISTFTPGEHFTAAVSSTRPALIPSQTAYIANAEVSLFQGEELLEMLNFAPGQLSSIPFYRSTEYFPVQNTPYSLKVSAPGFKTVTAEGSVPQKVSIRSVAAVHLGLSPSNKPQEVIHHYNITVTFDDPAAFHNYYHMRFHQEVLEYRSSEGGDTVITGKYLNHLAFGTAINNNTITAYLDDGVLFEDETFNGRRVSFSFPIQTRILSTKELLGHLFVELRAASESYYRFYNSVGRQQDNPGTPYTNPIIVYSNIESGRGVFAGYNVSVDSTRVIW